MELPISGKKGTDLFRIRLEAKIENKSRVSGWSFAESRAEVRAVSRDRISQFGGRIHIFGQRRVPRARSACTWKGPKGNVYGQVND